MKSLAVNLLKIVLGTVAAMCVAAAIVTYMVAVGMLCGAMK